MTDFSKSTWFDNVVLEMYYVFDSACLICKRNPINNQKNRIDMNRLN